MVIRNTWFLTFYVTLIVSSFFFLYYNTNNFKPFFKKIDIKNIKRINFFGFELDLVNTEDKIKKKSDKKEINQFEENPPK